MKQMVVVAVDNVDELIEQYYRAQGRPAHKPWDLPVFR